MISNDEITELLNAHGAKMEDGNIVMPVNQFNEFLNALLTQEGKLVAARTGELLLSKLSK